MSYSFSTDGNVFRGEYNTPEAAAIGIFNSNRSMESIKIGKIVRHPAAHYMNAKSIIEDIQAAAEDTGGEYAEDWLSCATYKDGAELEALIGTWIEKKFGAPEFYKVIETQTITRAELIAKGLLQEDAA